MASYTTGLVFLKYSDAFTLFPTVYPSLKYFPISLNLIGTLPVKYGPAVSTVVLPLVWVLFISSGKVLLLYPPVPGVYGSGWVVVPPALEVSFKVIVTFFTKTVLAESVYNLISNDSSPSVTLSLVNVWDILPALPSAVTVTVPSRSPLDKSVELIPFTDQYKTLDAATLVVENVVTRVVPSLTVKLAGDIE